jgi:hypothetical protein
MNSYISGYAFSQADVDEFNALKNCKGMDGMGWDGMGREGMGWETLTAFFIESK